MHTILAGDHKSYSFNSMLLEYFGAVEGAFSAVTGQEAEKSQITITGPETNIVESHFQDTIHIGPKSDNPEKATKQFLLYQNGQEEKLINLTVNHPKPAKTELQVYMNGTQGFKSKAGDIWFVFRREGFDHLFIGSMIPAEWAAIAIEQSIDEDDETFQLAINIPMATKLATLVESMKYPREFAIARECLPVPPQRVRFDMPKIVPLLLLLQATGAQT